MTALPPLPQAINPLVQVQTWQPTQPWADYFKGLDGFLRDASGGSGSSGGIPGLDALAYNGMQINGSMEVSQENGTTAVVVSGTQKYIVDGWFLVSSGTQVVTGTQANTPPPGFNSFVVIQVGTANASPSAGNYVLLQQNIEGYRAARVAFGTSSAASISIGFWVISVNRTGTLSGSLRNGAANRSYVFTVPINTIATWEYKTVTIPGDTAGTWLTDNRTGLTLSFALMAGSTFTTAAGVWTAGNLIGAPGATNFVASVSDIVGITGVVVLPGIEAPSAARSPYIMRPFPQELEICRRYYQKSYDYPSLPGSAPGLTVGGHLAFEQGLTGASVTVFRTIDLSPRMRSDPTALTYSSNSGVGGKVYDANGAGDQIATVIGSGMGSFIWSAPAVIASAAYNLQYHWTADARL